MTREDFELVLEALENYKDTREVKKLKEKISIFIDRQKLDEDYQEKAQKLADRMKDLSETEIDKK